jgi:tRNA modification GTPase
MKLKSTTIAAAATFPAVSALAVIRLSGPESFPIMDRVFSFHNRGRSVQNVPSSALSLGLVLDDDMVIDEVFTAFFRAPASFTGEDMAEITCHGSPYISRRIMETLVKNGALPAGPGDFTRRAFINGKMDLTQAEAVSSIMCATSDASLKISLDQLFGRERESLEKIKLNLINAIALVEADLDFEHGSPDGKYEIIKWIDYTLGDINRLLRGAKKASVIKNGVRITIAGKPNTGKSTILNRLLGRDRAIVTDIAGTTRDTIEEEVVLNSIPFLIADTAGLREPVDAAEKEGVKRTKDAVSASDAVIFAMDSSLPISPDDAAAYAEISAKPHVVVLNKSDLNPAFSPAEAKKYIGITGPIILISAKEGANMELLKDSMKNMITTSKAIDNSADPVVSEARHVAALEKSALELREAVVILEKGLGYEKAAEHLKYASGAVSSITGDIGTDDVLDAVFKNFCVGK